METEADGRRDFDFLDGQWQVLVSRLADRLQGSTEWREFKAKKEVRPVLGGIGHVDRFVAVFPDGRPIEAMTLRIFDPATRLWSLYWVDNRSCRLEPPVVGGFSSGRGEFLGGEIVAGRSVRVRIIWTDITATSARMEQACSDDEGNSWETNLRMALVRDG